MSSSGPYGVYHSVFDNFAWFKKFGDPDFVYEQQMARVFGLEAVRMADADVLPYDYEEYGKEIEVYLEAAQQAGRGQVWGAGAGFPRGGRGGTPLSKCRGEDLGEAEKPAARMRCG